MAVKLGDGDVDEDDDEDEEAEEVEYDESRDGATADVVITGMTEEEEEESAGKLEGVGVGMTYAEAGDDDSADTVTPADVIDVVAAAPAAEDADDNAIISGCAHHSKSAVARIICDRRAVTKGKEKSKKTGRKKTKGKT